MPRTRKSTKPSKTARKATTRKSTARRAGTKTKAKTAKRVAKKAAPKALGKISSPFTKSDLLNHISEEVELTRKQVSHVFDSLANVIHHHLKKAGPGEVTIPGLMKCQVKVKPATKARKGINPFTGEMTTFKAKPARRQVKIRPLKKLKEMAG